ncbi:hypothetical protein CXG81DRAFT_15960 [Caulochytrium protostelioides]|uniref:Rho GTPase activation protein n=1 Tax=Caulochytrium protostelioides TaxID=1555241 RepID=A0A4P9WY41_9FUNG|nr:hypothetical protein CXG81DRAFT_15960 [Caulochytrium protostelioides]|eukprot:RKO98401.1 hypothetical protein CXG81DRAFT_15960 [Caulochytrium protostelioides]
MESLNRPALPADLSRELQRFRMDGFAKKYFSEHRTGIFRKKVPVEKMLGYQKDAIRAPLMMLRKDMAKEAIKCFRCIQKVMSVPMGVAMAAVIPDIEALLSRGISRGELRDEIYVQMCKQLTRNPNADSIQRGWQLLCVLPIGFPPSKNFEDYMQSFIASAMRDPVTEKLATHANKKFVRICRTGPRGKTPSAPEIERALEAPFIHSVFGEPLEDIMQLQRAAGGAEDLPRILPFLVHAIIDLHGCTSEGIFRVPGDSDLVVDLRCRIEKGQYDLNGVRDPNVPSSLFKLWLRELADPLISADVYDECIALGRDEGREDALAHARTILAKLPETHQRVCDYVITFLQKVAEPQNVPLTKMNVANLAMVFAPNFLRCPSDNPTTIFENTKFEQGFLRILISARPASTPSA